VLTTASWDETAFPGVAVKVLPARIPGHLEKTMALKRAAGSSRALASVQRQLADRMGAVSDLAGVDVGRYDIIVGIGVRSPHVRTLMTRALGAVPGVWQLTAEDVAVCAMPLLRQSMLSHRLVSHWSELSVALERVLQRQVGCVTPSAEGWLDSPDFGALAEKLGLPGQYVLWAPAPGAFPAPPQEGPIASVVFNESTLHSRRLDPVVAKACAVVIASDAGDLAVAAMRSAVPVVIAAGSPGARWVAESPLGTIVTNPSEVVGTVQSISGSRSRSRYDAVGGGSILPAHLWAHWYVSQF
jgi:hypothetical protein